ncbi:hypothetical protein JTE90_023010 [Oedothorax gibbosus]|uniref:Uncharacterized protein n=1 Tax=Oedothorax gibbosus TaxID=931172 RepID=A0AAV6UAI6_9ARAC|nr:hypothetical protein JTE90_023010 [Oedothorax gibbosus]
MIDRFTRGPETFPIPDMKTMLCTAIFETWISRFGCLTTITTDRANSLCSISRVLQHARHQPHTNYRLPSNFERHRRTISSSSQSIHQGMVMEYHGTEPCGNNLG